MKKRRQVLAVTLAATMVMGMGLSTVSAYVIIPGLFEPPVRTLRATIPENESHIFR